MKYRIVTNGTWYEIEYRHRFLPLFWERWEPPRLLTGKQPVDTSLYRFDTVEDAIKMVERLKQNEKNNKFKPI